MATQTAVFAGGCFWCTEAAFQPLRGVQRVQPGYAGGQQPHPTYEQVCTGRTGHAEVVQVDYDPEQISYHDLLNVFFTVHDPTTLNRQGNDIGTQYRSAIFYLDQAQKAEAEGFITELNAELGGGIVTELTPLDIFHVAEEYHHDYFKKNPGSGYCQAVIPPKLAKLRKQYAELLAR
ncbi:MAG: peptide-methionine (S)-S-oxide reductase MsrA [Anaerolineales bacterium]|nr:peptide-methionine (S)-S-oxide reductase MsrA [Anaerolineales bacterium]MCW5855614.1 peptide-methionine (S)-S-oxide reductase MsrA [Anaerolineales bacterium]